MDEPKLTKRECKKHGKTEFVLESRGYYRCKKCRVENVNKRRRKLKKKAVEYKGGKCIIEDCGYNRCIDALEFHHRDPSQKDFKIGSGNTLGWEKIKKELDKCDLLCCRCHRELHSEQEFE